MCEKQTLDLLPLERSVGTVSKQLTDGITEALASVSSPMLTKLLEDKSSHDAIVAHIHAFFWAKHSKTFNAEDFCIEEIIEFQCAPDIFPEIKKELTKILAEQFGLVLHHFNQRINDTVEIYTFPLCGAEVAKEKAVAATS